MPDEKLAPEGANPETCPACGESIPAPNGAHGIPGRVHFDQDCPKCGKPLCWLTDGGLAGSWRING